MNRLTFRLLWVLIIGVFVPAVEGIQHPATLHLLNGHSMQGSFLRQDEGTTRFDFFEGKEQVDVPSKYIHYVQLNAKGYEMFPHRIECWNGDRLYGEILTVDESFIHLKTAWSNSVRIHQSYVKRIQMDVNGSVLWKGPGTLKDWKVGTEKTSMNRYGSEVRESATGILFKGSGAIYRDIPFSSQGVTLKLGLIFPQGRQSFSISIDDLPGTKNKNGIMVYTFSNRYVYCRIQDPKTGRFLTNWRMGLPDAEWVRDREKQIEISLNPVTRQKTLVYNGVIIREWPFPESLQLEDENMRLEVNVQSFAGESIMTDLDVFSGNQLTTRGHNTPDATRMTFIFQNGDQLKGDLTGITDEELLIKVEGAEAPIPVQKTRVTDILFPNDPSRMPRRLAEDIILSVNQSMDRLTVQVVESGPEKLSVRSGLWEGVVEIPMSLVNGLDFNPYIHFTVPHLNPSDPGDLKEID